MTIAQLIEVYYRQELCSRRGTHGGTPFLDTNVHDLADILEGQGFEVAT